jgi:hypothetical protein
MQASRIVAGLVLSLSCAIGAAACVQGTETSPETPREQETGENEDTRTERLGIPATHYIDCRTRGLNALACSEACSAVGAACGSIAAHPYKSGQGTGQLTWCKNGEPTFTCTYTFANGDGCALTYTMLGSYWICSYAGGN